MAEANKQMSVFVTGGAEDVGLATVRALLKRGHKVVASACTSEGALALRQAGALPVYPDLGRPSEVRSALEMARAEAVIHAIPQFCGGLAALPVRLTPGVAINSVHFTEGVAEATAQHGVGRFVSLSFGYLYEGGHGAAQEGDHDAHDSDYAPMQAAEALLTDSGLKRLHRPQRLHIWRQEPVDRSAGRCHHGVPARTRRKLARVLDPRR